MKVLIVGIVMLTWALPAFAQLGQIERGLQRARQVQDLQISNEEENQLGAMVSERIRQRYGVVQDPHVHRYVTLVGTVLAEGSERPGLSYRFIVLDTDAVNAFAAPGGYIHVTRGALGLMEDEAELAGVLGHEIAHVASKHTVEAIQKNRLVQFAADEALSNRRLLLDRLAQATYDMVVESGFDRNDEFEADRLGVAMASRAGYEPSGLNRFLTRLAERNAGVAERRGLFASHPLTQERLARITKQIASAKLTSTGLLAERFAAHITYEAVPQSAIATIEPGAAGLTGSGSGSQESAAKEEDAKAESEPAEKGPQEKRRGFGLSRLKAPLSGGERRSAEVTGSGGARGVDPDRDASGGPNPAIVTVTITPEQIAEFKAALTNGA